MAFQHLEAMSSSGEKRNIGSATSIATPLRRENSLAITWIEILSFFLIRVNNQYTRDDASQHSRVQLVEQRAGTWRQFALQPHVQQAPTLACQKHNNNHYHNYAHA